MQVAILVKDVGEQALQPPLRGDFPGVGEQRRRARIFAATRRDAGEVQVGRAFLGPQAPVLRPRQDAEAFRGAPEIPRHGVRQSEVVGDHQNEMIVARLHGAGQRLLPDIERLGGAILTVADDRQRIQDAGPKGGVPVLQSDHGLHHRRLRTPHFADLHE